MSRGNYKNPCLTMHQPWASLLVHGIKRIEGRSWPAPIRGRLWIHAASKVPDEATIKAMEEFYQEIYAVDGITDIQFPQHYPVSRLIVFLHHMASFDGPKFQMTDGSYVQTKAIDVGSSTDISPYLSLIREDSILNGNRAVIFDVYWDVELLETGSKKSGWSLSSVKLSTRNLCLFLRLPKPFHDNLKDLYRFFASKFVTFVGVQIEEDLDLLRENHGLVIRNAIEIGKLAE